MNYTTVSKFIGCLDCWLVICMTTHYCKNVFWISNQVWLKPDYQATEPMLKKRAISNDIVTVLKADINCKMTSVLVLDGVTSFLRLKDAVNLCDTVHLLA